MIDRKYLGEYHKMIDELTPLLKEHSQKKRPLEYLEFRNDLDRGDKKLIYKAIARLLKDGSRVPARGYCVDDLFWWLADERHSNLDVKFQSLKRVVYQLIRGDY